MKYSGIQYHWGHWIHTQMGQVVGRKIHNLRQRQHQNPSEDEKTKRLMYIWIFHCNDSIPFGISIFVVINKLIVLFICNFPIQIEPLAWASKPISEIIKRMRRMIWMMKPANDGRDIDWYEEFCVFLSTTKSNISINVSMKM